MKSLTIKLDDEAMAAVKAEAEHCDLSLEEAAASLVWVGARRLMALNKYAKKTDKPKPKKTKKAKAA